MNPPGALLDTGPLVALLSRRDANHEAAKAAFGAARPPFRTCEAVIAEACFLMRKVDPAGPAEVIALGRKGVYDIALSLREQWPRIEGIMRKYADRPVSLADACLIRCAELFDEPRVVTFDADFRVYRWRGAGSFVSSNVRPLPPPSAPFLRPLPPLPPHRSLNSISSLRVRNPAFSYTR